MKYNEMMEQLQDVLQDKEKYVDPDDPDDIFKKDVDALKYAIKIINESNILHKRNTSEIEYLNDEIEFYKEIIKKLIEE